MGALTVAAVVLLPFPFSDLSDAKVRPAIVLSAVGRADWILCQITSNPYGDPAAHRIQDSDFQTGGLRQVSYVRPGKLFTANTALITRDVGVLRALAFKG